MIELTSNDDNNLDIRLSIRDDLRVTLNLTAGESWAGKTFTAFIVHDSTTTPITVTNTIDASQRTLALDKAVHATIGAGRWFWYAVSVIGSVDVEEFSGHYEITP